MATIDPKPMTTSSTVITDGTYWPPTTTPYIYPTFQPTYVLQGYEDDYANEIEADVREHDVTLTFRRNSRVVKRITVPRSVWDAR
jgi:hypothetical protein